MGWERAENYEYTLKHEATDWAWEFLRRNPNYSSQWQKAFSEFQNQSSHQVLMEALLADDLSPLNYLHELEFNLTDFADKENFIILHPEASQWGLIGYQNPESSKLKRSNRAGVRLRAIDVYNSNIDDPLDDYIRIEAKDWTVNSSIDVSLPIAPQIAVIQSEAVNLQKTLKNSKAAPVRQRAKDVSDTEQELWLTYIRVLDAKLSGVDRKVASKVLTPPTALYSSHDERWDEVLKAANAMVESGYRSRL